MEKELKSLKEKSLEEQLKYISEYIDYVFKGDDPEAYLMSTFPNVWNIYLVQYFDSQIQNGGFRQFLWNTQGAYNEELTKTLNKIEAKEYIEAFEKILVRFNKNSEEKRTFLSNDFSDERSSVLRKDLREITWNFLDLVDANKEVKSLPERQQEYINKNIIDISKELAKIRK